ESAGRQFKSCEAVEKGDVLVATPQEDNPPIQTFDPLDMAGVEKKALYPFFSRASFAISSAKGLPTA
ncbi:TPA: hypothetical protein ACHKAQ_005150, partial [Escherichia coli]